MRASRWLVDLVDRGKSMRRVLLLTALVLAVPALELALDVAVVAAEVAEADGSTSTAWIAASTSTSDSDALRRCSTVQRLGGGHVADDGAVDEVHDVERRAVDRVVGAQADDGRRPARRWARAPR